MNYRVDVLHSDYSIPGTDGVFKATITARAERAVIRFEHPPHPNPCYCCAPPACVFDPSLLGSVAAATECLLRIRIASDWHRLTGTPIDEFAAAFWRASARGGDPVGDIRQRVQDLTERETDCNRCLEKSAPHPSPCAACTFDPADDVGRFSSAAEVAVARTALAVAMFWHFRHETPFPGESLIDDHAGILPRIRTYLRQAEQRERELEHAESGYAACFSAYVDRVRTLTGKPTPDLMESVRRAVSRSMLEDMSTRVLLAHNPVFLLAPENDADE